MKPGSRNQFTFHWRHVRLDKIPRVEMCATVQDEENWRHRARKTHEVNAATVSSEVRPESHLRVCKTRSNWPSDSRVTTHQHVTDDGENDCHEWTIQQHMKIMSRHLCDYVITQTRACIFVSALAHTKVDRTCFLIGPHASKLNTDSRWPIQGRYCTCSLKSNFTLCHLQLVTRAITYDSIVTSRFVWCSGITSGHEDELRSRPNQISQFFAGAGIWHGDRCELIQCLRVQRMYYRKGGSKARWSLVSCRV